MRAFTVFVFAFLAVPAWSYLVQNSTFDTDIAGWDQIDGTWVHRADDGILGVGAPVSQVGVWQRFTGSFEVPSGAMSVAVFVGENDGTPTDRFLVDSIFLAPPLD